MNVINSLFFFFLVGVENMHYSEGTCMYMEYTIYDNCVFNNVQRECCHLIICILFQSGNEKAKGNPPRVQTSLFGTNEYQPPEASISRTRRHIYSFICAHGRKFQNLF